MGTSPHRKDDEDIAEHREIQELSKGKDELIPREVVQKEPSLPDLATREAPNQEFGRSKRKRKQRKRDEWVRMRRKIVKANPNEPPAGLCVLFDDAKIPLPPDSAWETHRKDERPWVSAFDDPLLDYSLRQRIYVIVRHDKVRG